MRHFALEAAVGEGGWATEGEGLADYLFVKEVFLKVGGEAQ